MSGNIKGITIEFRGDTTKLDSALKDINKNTRSLDKELRNVDKALKFNPTSVELWRQKQDLLKQKIGETKDKLDVLKQAQAKLDAQGVDKNSEEYKKLKREIVETESKVKTFEGQLRKIGQVNLRASSEQFKQMGTRLENAGNAMRGLSTAAAAVTASIGALAVKSGQWADNLNTMSKVYSIGTGELQKYSAAAGLVDVSTEDIAKATTKLKKSMYSAKDGTGASAEAYKALGVEITDANGNLRDSDSVFQDVLKSLGQMENETERDALAMQLMGKSAQNLNPLIQDGGETYKNVAETLKKYNLDFIDQNTLDQANQFNDQIDTIKTIGLVAFQNVGAQLAGTLAPALEKVVDYVGRFAEWLGNLNPEVLAVVAAIGAVVAAVAPVLIILGKVSFAISSIMSLVSTIGPVIAGIAAPIGIAIGVIAAIIAAFVIWRKHGDKIKKFFADFGKKIADVWNKMKEAVSNAIESLKKIVSDVFSAIKNIIMTIVNGYVAYVRFQFELMKKIITTVINGIKTVITTVFNLIKTAIQLYVNGWVTVIKTAWNLIKTTTTTVVNGIKTTVTTVFNAIKSFVSTVWNGIKTAITTPINAARDTISNVVQTIKSKISGGFSGIAGTVRSAFNAVKEAITSPIQKAWDLVKSAINKIKGLFPLRLGKIFSGIKLPHFKISGGQIPWGIGGKGTPPSVSIDWYKKAMNNPYMFSSPTVIGVGEAGSEIVYGRNSLMRDITKAVASGSGLGGVTINVYGSDNMSVNELAAEVERRIIALEKRRRLAWQ